MITAWILVGLGVALTVGTAVFVAAEFSLVALDPSQLDEKHRGDHRVQRALRRLATQLSGAQVGITLTTIMLGYTAQPALAELLDSPLESTPLVRAASGTIAGIVSLVLVNAFSMVIGELLPKNLALSASIRTARVTAPLNMFFTTALAPVIAVLNGMANAILRLVGIEPREELAAGRSRQELAALVRRSAQAGTLAPSTALLLKNTIQLAELAAIDVMTDRTRMVVVPRAASAADVVAQARATGHSRFPVIGESHDDVLGLVHLHQAISVPFHLRDTETVANLIVEAPRVPETMRLEPLLAELRGPGLQMAIVVDEYGGTAGLVTLEDVVEELVGDVADEHDRRRAGAFRSRDGGWSVPGLLRPDELEEATGIRVPDDAAYETIGGLVMARLGRVAATGDQVQVEGVDTTKVDVAAAVTLVVERMDGRRIERLRVSATALEEAP